MIAVYTQKDMPQTKFGAFVQDETALADGVVRYQGEGVAAVIAVDEETALRGIEAIEVAYEPIEGVYDPEAAMAEGAPQIHEGTERNVAAHNRVAAGDIDAGFAEADHVFEDRFITSRQCHVCMEPHALVADYDPSGRVTLHISSQSTFFDRFGLEGIFGLPANKIRIISPYLGGGFGSKSEPHSIYVVAIQASMNLGRPVKMFHSRDEEFTSSRTRHPEIIDIKTGVKNDGTITARSARVILDNGAYTSYGPGVSLTQSMLGGAVYRIPAYRYDGYTVYTNNPFGGAFRGFGSPQFTFAAECHTDMIAERLGMDAVEFRRLNLSRPGDTAISGPTLTSLRREGVRREGGRRDRLGRQAREPEEGPGGGHRLRGPLHQWQVPPQRQRRLLRRRREGQRGRLGVADDRRDRDGHRRGDDRDRADLRRGARRRAVRRRRDQLGLRDDPGRLRHVRQPRHDARPAEPSSDACEQVRGAALPRRRRRLLEADAGELAMGGRKVFVTADPSR